MASLPSQLQLMTWPYPVPGRCPAGSHDCSKFARDSPAAEVKQAQGAQLGCTMSLPRLKLRARHAWNSIINLLERFIAPQHIHTALHCVIWA